MRSLSRPVLTGLVLLAASAAPAGAHIVSSRLGDFYSGALHPLTDLRELVVWLALALLAAGRGDTRGRWTVLAFPLGLLLGVRLAGAVDLVSRDQLMIAGSMSLLGLLLAAAVRLPPAALAALAVLVGAARGAANAGDLAAETDLLLFAAGLAAAGYAVVTLATAGVGWLVAPSGAVVGWRGIALRALGSWIAAAGLMLGALALTRV